MHSDAGYASTLKALEPDLVFQTPIRRTRLSMRYQGSMLQTLRKPSRLPDVHRPFVVGDPPQRIDWRAYARTDQLLIREVQEEAAARILIVVDTADTMFWPSPAVNARLPWPALSKWEVAVRVACNLAFAHCRAGDAVHFVILAQGVWKRLPSRTSDEVLAIFHWLKQGDFSADALRANITDADQAYMEVGDYEQRIFISDMLAPTLASDLNSQPWTLLHCLSPFEIKSDWFRDDVNYFDTGGVLTELPGKYLNEAQRYQKAIDQWRNELERKYVAQGGSYFCMTEQTKVHDLQHFVAQAYEATTP